MKCKGKTKTGKNCPLTAQICGYCLMHYGQDSKSNRTKLINKLNKKVGWKEK